jgi:hypothetical protein
MIIVPHAVVRTDRGVHARRRAAMPATSDTGPDDNQIYGGARLDRVNSFT